MLNGLEVLWKLAEDDFDVLFLDVGMPVMDGMQTVGYIRYCEGETPTVAEGDQGGQAELLACFPVIALTAHAMSKDRQMYLDAGMDGYISKPFQLEEMVGQLEKVCRTR